MLESQVALPWLLLHTYIFASSAVCLEFALETNMPDLDKLNLLTYLHLFLYVMQLQVGHGFFKAILILSDTFFCSIINCAKKRYSEFVGNLFQYNVEVEH